ncbi:hypothetical protein H8K47_08155 [Undibacterium sp. CY7W]|uniref:Uncharacterized protein n=1 Tax=Undibacterium rugosum TaxID=2762291 RepID=A0A923KZ12_9BURK|nr:hypothetical protein [Undibacterium rugosum]MBC3935330.1 hypothetical protein [Undibacterium rugosum]
MMNEIKDIVGFKIAEAERRAHWADILSAWVGLQLEFANQLGSAAYCYTERTNVGLLAQAALRAGRFALEEYQVVSSKTHGPLQEVWAGHCDCWLSGGEYGELIEAKQEFLAIRSPLAAKQAERVLDQAVAAASMTRGDAPLSATGLAFLPVFLRASCNPEGNQFETELQNLALGLQACNADFVAWCFPSATRNYLGHSGTELMPGILLLGRAVAD